MHAHAQHTQAMPAEKHRMQQQLLLLLPSLLLLLAMNEIKNCQQLM
jgi:hypothetical protein